MKYYSEKTNRFYSTVAECERAEEEFDLAEAEAQRLADEAKAAEEALSAEVDAAYKEYVALYDATADAFARYKELAAKLSATRQKNTGNDFIQDIFGFINCLFDED